MKEWKDIPEYKKLYDECCKDCLILQENIKNSKQEFPHEQKVFHDKWWFRLKDFTKKYRKEHPEEFDENGKFKQ